MKIIIYACYLPGSLKPDYISSHQADPTPDSQYGKYVGAGAWVSRSGSLHILRSCHARPWGIRLMQMTPQERLAIRVDTLDIVDDADRWTAEARAIREYQPPFNAAPTTANAPPPKQRSKTPQTSHNT